MVETHLLKEEQIQIPEYKNFRKDCTTNNSGILIATKEKLKTIVAEVNREKKIDQTQWILLNNQKIQKSQNGSHIRTPTKCNIK